MEGRLVSSSGKRKENHMQYHCALDANISLYLVTYKNVFLLGFALDIHFRHYQRRLLHCGLFEDCTQKLLCIFKFPIHIQWHSFLTVKIICLTILRPFSLF